MKKFLLGSLSAVIFLASAQADEKYDHFPSLEAANISTALCNLAKYDEMLRAIVNKKQLSTEDMVKVHEITYTLENAIFRLQKDLKIAATELEAVHEASEHLDQQTIQESSEKYLSFTQLLSSPKACK